PLRSRLLIALPAINVITGVAVAGLSHSGHATLANLGIDVLIALAVALTLSLWLTVLLASSVVVPIWRLRDATARVAQGDLAERASAREVVALLNDLHERIVPVILRHGGHANKFIGDGLLAVFGTPERHADHADRAVAAALEIAELVRDAYNGELRVGVGVNS